MYIYIKKISTLINLFLFIFLFSCVKNDNSSINNNKIYNIDIGQSSINDFEDLIRKNYVVSMKNDGYIEDINVKYNYINAKGKNNYAEQVADEFYKNEVDLILTIGDNVTKAVCEKYKDSKTKILYAGVHEPKELNILDDNIVGVKISFLAKEQLEFINHISDDIKNVGIVYAANDNISKINVDYLKFYATSIGMDIYSVSINSVNDLETALNSLYAKNIDCILTVKDSLVSSEFEKILKYANNINIPIFSNDINEIKNGATCGLVIDANVVGEETAKISKMLLNDSVDIKTIQSVNVDKYKIYLNENNIKKYYPNYDLSNEDNVVIIK